VLAELILAAMSVSAVPADAGPRHDHSVEGLSVVPKPALAAQNLASPDAFSIYPAHIAVDNSNAPTVNRLVGGIISYVRWPDSRPAHERSLCVVGTPQLADSLRPTLPGNGHMSVMLRSARDVTQGSHCDILYMGQMTITERQQLIGWVRNKPVLTMTDADYSCAYGAMFCLGKRRQGISFSVNLDAIGRGPLRVDPRVLRIGTEG
jgi:hypothetical protein